MRVALCPLVGREEQVARVRELLGSGPARLVFDGPAGSGKTALLEVTAGLAGEAGSRVLRAQGHPRERDFASPSVCSGSSSNPS